MTVTSPDPNLLDASGRYEIYRVFTDREGLLDALRDRVDELQFARSQVDAAGKLTSGHAAKILCDPPIKHLGDISIRKMLRGTGLVVALVKNDERFAEVRDRLGKRKRPPMGKFAADRAREQPNGSSTHLPWLITSDSAHKMNVLRKRSLSEARRKSIAKKAGKASGRKRRKNMRERLRERRAKNELGKSGAPPQG